MTESTFTVLKSYHTYVCVNFKTEENPLNLSKEDKMNIPNRNNKYVPAMVHLCSSPQVEVHRYLYILSVPCKNYLLHVYCLPK